LPSDISKLSDNNLKSVDMNARKGSCSFLLLFILSSCATDTAPSSNIFLGGVFSTTGATASLDNPALRGAQLAIREINENGGLLGGVISMPVLDARGDSIGAHNAAQGLIEQHVSALIGLSDSYPATAAALVANKNGVPFLTVGATSPKLPEETGNQTFLACFGDNVQAAAGAEFAYDNLHERTVYLLTNTSTLYTTLLSGYFKTRWTELAGSSSIGGENSYTSEWTDLAAQIADIKQKNPSFLYIAAMPEDLTWVIPQIRTAGITTPIIGGDGYDAPTITALPPAQSDSVYFTTHALMETSGTASIRAFMAAYKSEYGIYPENAFAALGYDAVKLFAQALTNAGTSDPSQLREAFEQIRNFPGTTGSISFSAASHVPKKAVTVIAMKSGKYTFAAEFVPRGIPAP
jgi:branched-chain amino acid transport system substrate-binding protein